MSERGVCHCGKNILLMNKHNRDLHLRSCKKRKNCVSNASIQKFFIVGSKDNLTKKPALTEKSFININNSKYLFLYLMFYGYILYKCIICLYYIVTTYNIIICINYVCSPT